MNKEKVIVYLNKLLVDELTSVHQYFLYSTVLKEVGISKLAEKMSREINEELKHTSKLAERILFLRGVPNFQDINEIVKYNGSFTKDTILEILENTLKLEEKVLKDYKETVFITEEEKDFVSLILLEDLLKCEEEHFSWIERQINLIKIIGIGNYVKTQV